MCLVFMGWTPEIADKKNMGHENDSWPMDWLLGDQLEKLGYKPFISKILELGPNNQYKYDHRFDEALYIDTRYIKNIKKFLSNSY